MAANSARVMSPSGSKFPSLFPLITPREARDSMAGWFLWAFTPVMSGKVASRSTMGIYVTAGSFPSSPSPGLAPASSPVTVRESPIR